MLLISTNVTAVFIRFGHSIRTLFFPFTCILIICIPFHFLPLFFYLYSSSNNPSLLSVLLFTHQPLHCTNMYSPPFALQEQEHQFTLTKVKNNDQCSILCLNQKKGCWLAHCPQSLCNPLLTFGVLCWLAHISGKDRLPGAVIFPH